MKLKKPEYNEQAVFEFLHAQYNKIAPQIIIDTAEGVVMFRRYTVCRAGAAVRVRRHTDDLVLEFCLLKHAAAWCVLDKYNKIVEANRLYAQDGALGALLFEEQQFLALAASKDNWRHLLSMNKLSEVRARLAQTRRETDKYVQQARILYSKDKQNGTIRTTN